jgi:hypothetical protein
MGVLDKIKLVQMSRKVKASAAHRRRAKLIEQLQEQLKMAEAMLNGTVYERTKSTWVKDAEGNRVRVQRPVRVRAWWDAAGNSVQFGRRWMQRHTDWPTTSDPEEVGPEFAINGRTGWIATLRQKCQIGKFRIGISDR